MICTAHPILCGGYNLEEWDGLGMWRVWVRRGECIGSWWGNRRERDHLGRPRRRWVGNIRMDLQEVGCGHVGWIGLAQDRDRWRTLVSAAMNLRIPWNAGYFLTSCEPVNFSRRTLHHGVSKSKKSELLPWGRTGRRVVVEFHTYRATDTGLHFVCYTTAHRWQCVGIQAGK